MEQVVHEPLSVEQAQHNALGGPVALTGRSLRAARLVWFAVASVAVMIFVAALPAALTAISQGAYFESHQGVMTYNPDAAPDSMGVALTALAVGVGLGAALVSLALAFIIFWRSSRDRMALFVSFYLLYTGVTVNGPLELMEFYVPGMGTFTTDVLNAGGGVILTVGLLSLFPDGRFVPRWTRWLLGLSIIALPITLLFYAQGVSVLSGPYPLLISAIWAVSVLGAFYAQIYRYRRVSGLTARQQTKWIIYGFGLYLILSLLSAWPYIQMRGLESGESIPQWVMLFGVITYLPSLIVMPAVLTISVLLYRLWDIDILINRTLVYAALSAVVVTVYVVLVVVLGSFFHSSDDFVISLFATGIVALLFQPLREHLQRRVNRLMFGQRDEPYAVLERLSERLDLVVQTEQILPAIVETVAQTLKLPYVAITLHRSDAFTVAAEYGRLAEDTIRQEVKILPLVYQSEVVGQLILAPRAQGESFSPGDRQLLETIARQTSIAAYNVRLSEELQRSREELVTAREEERRRLRRDLHDGLGPVLATIAVGMDAISNLAEKPEATREIAQDVKTQAQSALDDIRRIAYDLRPPALDELGLIDAIKQHINASGHDHELSILIDTPETVPQLPAAVEVAAYRITLEAIQNVRHHAQASQCHLRLTFGAYLYLEIIDDGCGMPESYTAGVGLNSMRERAAELGGHFAIKPLSENGGTIVLAQLPLPDTAQSEALAWTTSAS